VISFVFHSGVHLTGRQLLFSGGVGWLTGAIAFGRVVLEPDCGGPIARARARAPRKNDFQFPKTERAARTGGLGATPRGKQ
jgi:hypothetical protein